MGKTEADLRNLLTSRVSVSQVNQKKILWLTIKTNKKHILFF